MTGKVVTRFAPSPTGFLHIGGARTALFNWLYARANGGSFMLRVEDTDRARSTEAATLAILDGMRWLDLHWDGEVVYQSERAARHTEVANQLLADGKAYRCYCTPEELEAMRENARKEGRPPVYEGTWRDRDPKDAPKGAKFAVRLKIPKEGETVVEDQVQGRVVFPNKDIEDLIILRSDGTPTYNLSVVVDDHDMGITHVIRGDDHLSNTPKQTHIYQSMGWELPVFAHVPMIHGPDGGKLSKRHGALGVEAYRAMGYLPAALRNYLVRLGWSHGDDEIFSTEQAVEWFNLNSLGKSPSRFDFAKLENLNGHYIRNTDNDELYEAMRHVLAGRMAPAMASIKERAKTVGDLIDSAQFLFAKRPLSLDEKATKILTLEARAVLAGLAAKFAALTEWTAETLDATARTHAQELGIKLGEVAQPLRAALTGRGVSPGIFEVLVALGRDEALARLADQTKVAQPATPAKVEAPQDAKAAAKAEKAKSQARSKS